MTNSHRILIVRKKELELDGEYAGWKCTVKTNPPLRVFSDLQSGDFDRIIKALSLVVTDWNFVDEEGQPMPKPSEECIGLLPLDLAMKVANQFSEAVTSLPPS